MIGSSNRIHGLAIVLFSAYEYNGPYTSDKISPSLRSIELDGGPTAGAPMRLVSNGLWRDCIDHSYLPKALSL